MTRASGARAERAADLFSIGVAGPRAAASEKLLVVEESRPPVGVPDVFSVEAT
jgi:hypothetical protein